MSIATVLAILATIIQDTPEAIALFQQVQSIVTGGTEPTAAQWSALVAAMAASHAKVQAA